MRRVCDDILKVKPDLVITEKGVSAHILSQNIGCVLRCSNLACKDLAQHFLMKVGTGASKLKRLGVGVGPLQSYALGIPR